MKATKNVNQRTVIRTCDLWVTGKAARNTG